MTVFSVHLARTSVLTTVLALLRPPKPSRIAGLLQVQCMTRMKLGAPVLSPSRLQPRRLVVFAAWEDEGALEAFLQGSRLGRTLAKGWHVRLSFLRRWGQLEGWDSLTSSASEVSDESPVVAVTVARMRLPQVPRFIHWGRPVEAQVRDHPGATLALAAMRLPRTVCTFTVWRTQRAMLDMVQGHSQTPRPKRHANAMVERRRKDFHFEFTTLRFLALSEHGSGKVGRTSCQRSQAASKLAHPTST